MEGKTCNDFYPDLANGDLVKIRYRELAREHHPDKGGNAEIFKFIQKCHEKYKSRKTVLPPGSDYGSVPKKHTQKKERSCDDFYPDLTNGDLVKERYRELVRAHHPDKGGDPLIFRFVNECYEKYKSKSASETPSNFVWSRGQDTKERSKPTKDKGAWEYFNENTKESDTVWGKEEDDMFQKWFKGIKERKYSFWETNPVEPAPVYPPFVSGCDYSDIECRSRSRSRSPRVPIFAARSRRKSRRKRRSRKSRRSRSNRKYRKSRRKSKFRR